MPKRCITKWIFLAVLVGGLFHTTRSIEVMPCEKFNKNCVLVTECVSALDLVKARAAEALRKMFCGFDQRGPRVCCPIDSPIVFVNDTDTATSRSKTTTVSAKIDNITQDDLPSRIVCGISPSNQDRIVGGFIASLEEFPWLVRIKSKRTTNNREGRELYNCAGSLISDRYVLTAAHCLANRDVISVRLGEWDTETLQDCQGGICSDPPVDINVTKVIIHSSYNETLLLNDIGLLQLEEAANFTDFIRPICLPITQYSKNQDYVAGTTFWTAGWGLTEFETPSIIKRKVNLNTVPLEDCRNAVPQVKKMNTKNIICAGGTIGKDSCNGDSGGPLVKEIVEDGYINWYLYGITSFGARKCGASEIPSVYTRVVSYMDWIKDNIVS
ncbi:unnamed protein product, partial [Iphiclides podalirius]